MDSKMSMPPVPIPEQVEGGETDSDYSKTAVDTAEAHELFMHSKERLLKVNEWDKIAGALSAVFKLTNAEGKEVLGKAKTGDFIKIDLPGPGTKAGEGFDWVRIETIEDNTNAGGQEETLLMRVRPYDNPANDHEDVAHFFTGEASSSFTLHRAGNTVTAGVHGRNEVPNIHTESLFDKARNSAVAITAVIGLSAPQWKTLCKGILGD